MEKSYEKVFESLKAQPRSWLVTGAAGFIGSNLCEKLIDLNQNVRAVDNFITGYRNNIEFLKNHQKRNPQSRFEFHQGDIGDYELCCELSQGTEFVLHQAALGSVSRSIEDPMSSHRHNVDGFFNILNACRENKNKLIYASSSSVYGDSKELPKVEDKTGQPLSPYAATKCINELYGKVFARTYEMKIVGLRYFNVFGPRQDPNGPYAAVIPKWVGIFLKGQRPEIYGDGETSRDFCFVDNAVQANIMAALNIENCQQGQVFNVAAERQTNLNELFDFIQDKIGRHRPGFQPVKPLYRGFQGWRYPTFFGEYF